ncbi:hypothetical protein Voc01_048110 [Virgisporangium ochraceum]|uniref:Uncharacterized protein n=1 Tax=Virgisporangium ochraceum TaxID=65505 RepID=A0A8J4ECQ7_9ACTN|nr:hypothetical protein Voc01_048110 [Virgisporangium ochraceum]
MLAHVNGTVGVTIEPGPFAVPRISTPDSVRVVIPYVAPLEVSVAVPYATRSRRLVADGALVPVGTPILHTPVPNVVVDPITMRTVKLTPSAPADRLNRPLILPLPIAGLLPLAVQAGVNEVHPGAVKASIWSRMASRFVEVTL